MKLESVNKFFLLWNLKNVYSLSSVSCTQRVLNNCLVCEKLEECLLNTEYLIRLCNKLKRVYIFCMFIDTFKFLDNHKTCSWYSIAPNNINESPKWNSSLLGISEYFFSLKDHEEGCSMVQEEGPVLFTASPFLPCGGKLHNTTGNNHIIL